jgi:predicted esterase
LAAALGALRARSDVDPTITLGLGFSIGGVSMLDLAARGDHPLTAVINISGGLYHDAKRFRPNAACSAFERDLVREVSSFGVVGVPTLWLYAANDPWFSADLISEMLRGYQASGGRTEFTMFPPFGADGHTLYRWEANALTQPKIDNFLRANHLPAMEDAHAFEPLLAALNAQDRDSVERYLLAPTEKALAVPESGDGAYWYFASRTIEDARHEALEHCRVASAKQCHVVADNRNLIADWRDTIALPANGVRDWARGH